MIKPMDIEKMLKKSLTVYVTARMVMLDEELGLTDTDNQEYYKVITTERVKTAEKTKPVKNLFTISVECQQYLKWLVDNIMIELSTVPKNSSDDAFYLVIDGTDILAWLPSRYPKIVIDQREVTFDLSAFRCMLLSKQLSTSAQANAIVDKLDRCLNDIGWISGSMLYYNKVSINAKFLSGVLCQLGLIPDHIESMKASVREPKLKVKK